MDVNSQNTPARMLGWEGLGLARIGAIWILVPFSRCHAKKDPPDGIIEGKNQEAAHFVKSDGTGKSTADKHS